MAVPNPSSPPAGSMIYGRHPVVDAIMAGVPFDKVFFQQGIRGEFEKEIRLLCRDFDIPLQVVPRDKLSRMAGGNHQGIIGFVALLTYIDLSDLLPQLYEKGENPLLVLLDGITDVRNLGAIARSAEVAGAHALVVPKKGSALINAEALKTSAGALSKLPVCRVDSLVSTVEWLQSAGVHVLATDLQADAVLYEAELTGPLAFIMGSEDQGVSRALLQRADQRIWIPQRGTTDSFNVSVAAGILLYETMRQRLLSA